MPQIIKSSRATATVVAALALAGLLLAACGGSSGNTTSSSANAAATTTTGKTGTSGAGGPSSSRFSALRECLQKNGITLPTRPSGQTRKPGTGGNFFKGGQGGGFKLPKGVSKAQYEAAIKKCGGSAFPRGGRAGLQANNPAFKQALAKFASCLRSNGINVPAPNTSGKGPVFDTKGINTTSAKFKAAESKCQSDLANAFRGGRGAPGAGGAPGGAPPTGGAAPTEAG